MPHTEVSKASIAAEGRVQHFTMETVSTAVRGVYISDPLPANPAPYGTVAHRW